MSDVSNLGGLLYTTTNAATKVVVAQTPCEFVIVQNDPDSAGDALIGGKLGQVLRLAPGDSTDPLCTRDVSAIWAKSAVADTAADLRILYGA